MNMLQHLPVSLTGDYTLRGFQEFAGGEWRPAPAPCWLAKAAGRRSAEEARSGPTVERGRASRSGMPAAEIV